MIVTKRKSGVLAVLRLVGIGALILALAITSTGTVAAFDRNSALEFRSSYNPRGIWSDWTTMWVAGDSDDKLYAYDLEDKTRVSAKDFDGLIAAGQ